MSSRAANAPHLTTTHSRKGIGKLWALLVRVRSVVGRAHVAPARVGPPELTLTVVRTDHRRFVIRERSTAEPTALTAQVRRPRVMPLRASGRDDFTYSGAG